MCSAVVCPGWINIEKFERAKKKVYLPWLLEVSIVCFDELDQFRCAFSWLRSLYDSHFRACLTYLLLVPFFCLFLTDMKFLVTLCLLAVCAVLVSSRDAVRNPFRRGHAMRDPRPDYEAWGPPEPDRTTQVPNCKTRGQSCQSSDDCCFCKTEGGYYSCMICSSYDDKCF